MYYRKLLKLDFYGELISPYGHDNNQPHIWKIWKWRKSDRYFYASETIVDALSAVWIKHFSVIAQVEIKNEIRYDKKLFPEVLSKEMRVVKAWMWPEYLNDMIEEELCCIGNVGELVLFGPSDYFFQHLSPSEKMWWENLLTREIRDMTPYGG